MNAAYYAETLFDGRQMHGAMTLFVADKKVVSIEPGRAKHSTDLGKGLIAPGFVDLQVNGGGGVMLNTMPTAETIARIQSAHLKRGTTFIAPTLITDKQETTQQVIKTAIVAGCDALHLEGPHLDRVKAGAHDPKLIRKMDETDLTVYVDAAKALRLIVTVAPASVNAEQVTRLANAGAIVSIGHSDASYEEVTGLLNAGARCGTHLFNAMSASTGRAPGVVGALLEQREVFAGLIADGIHVHPANLAMAARSKVGKLFLVSDSMATLGASDTVFQLNGREIRRSGDRLTLADGTLAGAHLDMAQAVRVMVWQAQVAIKDALAMATRVPAELLGLEDIGVLAPNARADFILLDEKLEVQKVWKSGEEVLL